MQNCIHFYDPQFIVVTSFDLRTKVMNKCPRTDGFAIGGTLICLLILTFICDLLFSYVHDLAKFQCSKEMYCDMDQ